MPVRRQGEGTPEPKKPDKSNKRSKTQPKAPDKARKAPSKSEGKKSQAKAKEPGLDDPGEAGGDGLNDRHRRFVQEYLVDGNATQAAIRAGYSKPTAAEQASRLLTNVRIQAAVRRGQRAIGAHLGITAENVLGEIARIAFGNLDDVVTYGTDARGRVQINLKPSDQLDPNAAAIVKSVGVKRKFFTTPDGDLVEVEEASITAHDKLAALGMLAKRLGLFAPDKVDVNVTADPNEVRNRILDKLTRLAPQEPKEGGEG